MEQNQAIFKALQKNDLKELKRALDQIPSINVVNEMGESLLHIAVRLNNPVMIDLILAYGPDLSHVNDDNLTALELALALQNGVAIQRILRSPLPIPVKLLERSDLSPYLILFRNNKVENKNSDEKDFSQVQDTQKNNDSHDFTGVFDIPQELITSNQEDFSGVYSIWPQEKEHYAEKSVINQEIELNEFKATIEGVTEKRATKETITTSNSEQNSKESITVNEVTETLHDQLTMVHEEAKKEEKETIKEVTQQIAVEMIYVKGSQDNQTSPTKLSSTSENDLKEDEKKGEESTLSYQNFKKHYKSTKPLDDNSLKNKKRSKTTGGSLASDINRPNNKGDYPLFMAIKKGELSMIEKLLSLGADVNIRDTEGHHALMVASYYGHPHLVEFFLKQGLPVNLKTPNAYSALYYAVAMNFPTIAEILIKAGAYLDQRVKNKTCLMNAAYHGREEIVKLLIKYGANPAVKTIHGKTAYDYAVIKGHLSIVQFLEQFNVSLK